MSHWVSLLKTILIEFQKYDFLYSAGTLFGLLITADPARSDISRLRAVVTMFSTTGAPHPSLPKSKLRHWHDA